MTGSANDGKSHRDVPRAVGALSVIASLSGCMGVDVNGNPPSSDESPRGSGNENEPAGEGDHVYERGDPGPEGETVEFLEHEIELAEKRLVALQGYRGWFPGGFDDNVIATAEEVGRTARQSVILLETESGHATAWFVEPNYLLTNSHNVSEPGTGTVQSDRLTGHTVDEIELEVDVIGHVPYAQPDVALLRTSFEGTPLPLASTVELEPGAPVLHIGHPGSVGNWVISLGRYLHSSEIAAGQIDNEPASDAVTTTLVSSAPGRQGNSGSPLLTLDGTVVGMTYGGEDRNPLTSKEDVKPTNSFVFEWAIAAEMWSNHVTIETAMEHVAEWI